MSSLSGQQGAGSDTSAPAPGQNQTGESAGSHQKTAEVQSSSKGSSDSGAGSIEKTGKGDALQDLSDGGEAGGTGGKIDESFVEGVKGKVKN